MEGKSRGWGPEVVIELSAEEEQKGGVLRPASSRGFTWVEVLVAIVMIGVLAALALPAVTFCGRRGCIVIQTLSNMKQLQLSTLVMTMDNQKSGKPERWTCSGNTPISFEEWRKLLVPQHLSEDDFRRMLAAPDSINALTVFAVCESDAPETTKCSWEAAGCTITCR